MPGDAPVSRLKIILLGDAAAGKTKLMQRFLVDGFNPRRLATHAVNIFPYTAKVDGKVWEVDFWDTAGQEKFDKLHTSYYFDADCCILVFDVTRKTTYRNLVKWHTELRESCPFVPVLCVANKIDADMSVTDREFTFATSNSIPLFFVSASSGINVVRTFNEAIRQAIQFKLEPKDEAMDELMRLVEEQYN